MYLTDASKYAVQARRMRAHIQRRGVNGVGAPLWTDAEDKLCRSLYPDYKALQAALPRRTDQAIRSRCRDLGIQQKLQLWTAAEETKFRRLYRSASEAELHGAFPTRSKKDIWSKAQYLGLKRPRKAYARTGVRLLDELREECHRLNINMVDLDQFARSRAYFRNKSWNGPRGSVRYDYIVRAIHELGGNLHVEWNGE